VLARYRMPGADLYGLSPAALVVRNDTVRVVYENYSGTRIVLGPQYNWHYEIYHGVFSVANPSGVTWQLLDSLSAVVPPEILEITSPSLSVYNGKSQVVWHRLGNILYKEQTGPGTWKPLVDVSQSGSGMKSWNPSSFLSGNLLSAAWMMRDSSLLAVIFPSKICYRSRLLDGADTTWGARETLSVGLRHAERPVLGLGPSVVFSGYNDGTGAEIYLANRTSGGWAALENVSNTAAGSFFPHLFTVQGASSRTHDILWTEGDNAPYEVVYKQVTKSVPPGPWMEAVVGKATPSSFNQQRDWYYSFGSEPYQSVDLGILRPLVYGFTGLKPGTKHRLQVVGYFGWTKGFGEGLKGVGPGVIADGASSGSYQSDDSNVSTDSNERSDPTSYKGWKIQEDVYVNGKKLGKLDIGWAKPETLSVEIPDTLCASGKLRIEVRGKKCWFATVGGLALYEWEVGGKAMGGGAPQAGEIATGLLPREFALGQSYPNPANNGLRIDYALPKESSVSLRIYNVAGQLVRALREGKKKPGYYVAQWDGKDQWGHRVSSGVYLYRMEAGEFRKTNKLVIVR